MALPLENVKILDLSRLVPGAYCSLLLADFGADVIKVEDTYAGDYMRHVSPLVNGVNPTFVMLNRNKRSIAVNLKTDEGRDSFLRLVKEADVLLEGFRPGVMKKLDLSYENIREINPSLIYCSLTGYGQSGPYRNRVGHDLNYVSIAGILSLNARKGEAPVIPGIQMGDIGAGGIMAACAILIALLGRKRGGYGQYLDIGMLDGLFFWQGILGMNYLATGHGTKAGESFVLGESACYNIYETADHKYLALAAYEDKFWSNFCHCLGRQDWIPLQFCDSPHKEVLISDVQDIFQTRSQQEWLDFFGDAEVCLTPVNNLDEVFEDAQIIARNMVVPCKHTGYGNFKQLANPLKFSEYKCEVRISAPSQGQNTDEILADVGFTAQDINKLRKKGCVK